jgi:hypothetical protein
MGRYATREAGRRRGEVAANLAVGPTISLAFCRDPVKMSFLRSLVVIWRAGISARWCGEVVISLFGRGCAIARVIAPRHEREADGLSARWIGRYRLESAGSW